ncbi:MAG: signal peptidase I [Caldilineales bacterium]|nr:signal peptidase I [Caldilineales bacterium]
MTSPLPHLPPDARIIRPEDQPERYDLSAYTPPPVPQTSGRLAAPSDSLIGQSLRELVSTVLPAVLIALLIHLFLAQATRVEGYSMEPTLYGHQRLVIEKVSYHLHPPHRGDIIVIHVPNYGREMLIKRVIGLPGETIQVSSGQVLIDGQPLAEPYLRTVTRGDYPVLTVPAGSVFVMGDNRNNSNDSRSFGPITFDNIVGRAWVRYWPFSDVGLVE